MQTDCSGLVKKRSRAPAEYRVPVACSYSITGIPIDLPEGFHPTVWEFHGVAGRVKILRLAGPNLPKSNYNYGSTRRRNRRPQSCSARASWRCVRAPVDIAHCAGDSDVGYRACRVAGIGIIGTARINLTVKDS